MITAPVMILIIDSTEWYTVLQNHATWRCSLQHTV